MKRALGDIRRGALCATACCAAACSSPREAMVADTDPAGWKEGIELTVPNTDTLTLRDITLYLKLDERFTEDTLTLRIATVTPDSLRCEEPLLLTLPRRTGPASLGHIVDIPYRRRARFARAGDYRMTLTPCRTVEGVEAVGIHIEKSE